MVFDRDELAALAFVYLGRQPWFAASLGDARSPEPELVDYEEIRVAPPGLARLLVACGDRRFQLLIGWRSPGDLAGALRGEDGAVLGALDAAGETVVVYDALADDELCLALLEVATAGRERASRVRPVASLASHASLVFDERLFMKCYRIIEPGPRPEVEVLFRLDEVGFNALLAPVARWRPDGGDLALVREFLPSALEGRLLALTSLRDLLAHDKGGDEQDFNAVGDPSDIDSATATAGGDFASEMRRLGLTTARMHLALAQAFGARELATAALDQALRQPDDPGGVRLREISQRVASDGALGQAIRLHGDFHLRRVMRSESGWLVTGFADDPLYATAGPDPSLPPRNGSPLEDVADMFFALGQVAREALEQRARNVNDRVLALAQAWCRRNRAAFLAGYLATAGIGDLLPADAATRDLMIDGFVLVREARYEATPSGS